MRLAGRLPTFADPGHFALRAAARAALVMPPVFALAKEVIGNVDVATYAAFGSFSILILADFGGAWRPRLRAYLALAAAGLTLIALGTLCSRDPWLAAGATAAVGFLVLFSGALGGYFAAGGLAAMLPFILPVTHAAPASTIPDRWAGYALAAVAGIAAQMLLWPARPRDRLRDEVATACRRLAELVDALAAEGAASAERRAAAQDAVAVAQRQFLATPYRPSGPAGATETAALLVDELDWLLSFTGGEPVEVDRDGPVLAASAAVLRAGAAALDGGGEPAGVDALIAAREAHAAQIVARVEALAPGEGPGDRDDMALGASVDAAFAALAISRAALRIGRTVDLARGDGTGAAAAALAAGEMRAAEHASLRSVWLRNSVRSALALAVAVFVAQDAGLQHGFWVVLGTLSVLRSNALSTGATVVDALVGTAVGIVAGALVVTVLGTDSALLWIALPPAVLLAAYAPRVISFAAGQAGFTLALLILFNLIQPVGWSVGLVRVEDVAIGFAISLAFGVLFWPRGAGAVLRRRLAAAYALASDAVAAALDAGVGGGDPDRAERAIVVADDAGRRLDEAFRQALAERSVRRVDVPAGAALVAGAARLRRTARSLRALRGMTDAGGVDAAGATTLDGERDALRAWYRDLGLALREGAAPPAVRRPDHAAHDRVLAGTRAAFTAGHDAEIRRALALTWAARHLENLRRLEERLVDPALALGPDAPQPTHRLPTVGRPAMARVTR
jgi:uncharacterized membrane protein YccC